MRTPHSPKLPGPFLRASRKYQPSPHFMPHEFCTSRAALVQVRLNEDVGDVVTQIRHEGRHEPGSGPAPGTKRGQDQGQVTLLHASLRQRAGRDES